MDSQTLEEMSTHALSGEGISEPQALRIAQCSRDELFDLLGLTNRVRRELCGTGVKLCSILNAKSGGCSEDCAFCAQSSHHKTGAKTFGLLPKSKILAAAKRAKKNGAREFSIVTSGKSINEKELDKIADAVAGIRKLGLSPCASLGILDTAALEKLAEAGLGKYHHNLETSRSFFPQICTTHDYEEDIQTVRTAREAGLAVCCGGIFGLGESRRDWVELAATLKELDVDSVPLNFHLPVEGTKLAGLPLLPALDALRVVLVFRLVMPSCDIVICGGRESTLRDLQCLVFAAGASGLMLGDYLTTTGRNPKLDLEMIKDLELETAQQITGGK